MSVERDRARILEACAADAALLASLETGDWDALAARSLQRERAFAALRAHFAGRGTRDCVQELAELRELEARVIACAMALARDIERERAEARRARRASSAFRLGPDELPRFVARHV